MTKDVLAWVWGMALILGLFLGVVSQTALDAQAYHRYYEAHGTAEELGVPEESLNEAMDMIVEYVKGQRSSMDGRLAGIGEVYNEKEKAHMRDVKRLYDNAMAVKYVCYGITLIGLVYAVVRRRFVLLIHGFFTALLCMAVLFGFLGMWAATGFDDFWTHFHQLFFDNDLWLMDPATDFMIRICPAGLFEELIGRILLWFVSALTVISIGCGVILKRRVR